MSRPLRDYIKELLAKNKILADKDAAGKYEDHLRALRAQRAGQPAYWTSLEDKETDMTNTHCPHGYYKKDDQCCNTICLLTEIESLGDRLRAAEARSSRLKEQRDMHAGDAIRHLESAAKYKTEYENHRDARYEANKARDNWRKSSDGYRDNLADELSHQEELKRELSNQDQRISDDADAYQELEEERNNLFTIVGKQELELVELKEVAEDQLDELEIAKDSATRFAQRLNTMREERDNAQKNTERFIEVGLDARAQIKAHIANEVALRSALGKAQKMAITEQNLAYKAEQSSLDAESVLDIAREWAQTSSPEKLSEFRDALDGV